MGNLIVPPKLTASPDLKTLIENRTSYSRNDFELNVFETHRSADRVALTFQDFVLTSMFRGKKVMHINGLPSFDYLPGESVILGPGEEMVIDFPEANEHDPTQCLAIEISADLVRNTIDLLNDRFPKADACGVWDASIGKYHFANDQALAGALNRVVALTIHEGSNSKDVLLDLTLKETLVRLMQTQAREILLSGFRLHRSSNPMAAAVQAMSDHLDGHLSIDRLAKIAGMSRAAFFVKFKQMYGTTPARFLQSLRIERGKKLLLQSDYTISQIAYECGFEHPSHFTIAFKRETGQSPLQYKRSVP